MEATATATRLAQRPVVLYPSPGMGHLVSMIELGKILGARGLPVTILVVEPPYNTGAMGPLLAGVSAANPSISFHHLPKPEPLPPVKSKHYEAVTFELIRVSNPHLHGFLVAASPGCALLDFFCGAALDVAGELRVPAHFFFTSGAEVLAFFLHLPALHERTAASFKDMGEEPVHVPGIPPFPATHPWCSAAPRRSGASTSPETPDRAAAGEGARRPGGMDGQRGPTWPFASRRERDSIIGVFSPRYQK